MPGHEPNRQTSRFSQRDQLSPAIVRPSLDFRFVSRGIDKPHELLDRDLGHADRERFRERDLALLRGTVQQVATVIWTERFAELLDLFRRESHQKLSRRDHSKLHADGILELSGNTQFLRPCSLSDLCRRSIKRSDERFRRRTRLSRLRDLAALDRLRRLPSRDRHRRDHDQHTGDCHPSPSRSRTRLRQLLRSRSRQTSVRTLRRVRTLTSSATVAIQVRPGLIVPQPIRGRFGRCRPRAIRRQVRQRCVVQLALLRENRRQRSHRDNRGFRIPNVQREPFQIRSHRERSERRRHVRRRLKPSGRIASQHPRDDRHQLAGQVAAQRRHRPSLFVANLKHPLRRVHHLIRRKRSVSGQQFEQRRAEAVNVRSHIDIVTAADLLRRDVVQRPHQLPRARQFAARNRRRNPGHGRAATVLQQRESKIEHAHDGRLNAVVAERDHQVRRLDIAMHQPASKRILQTKRHLPSNLARLGDRQRAEPIHDRRQVRPVNVFHHQITDVVMLARIHRPHDVGMFEPSDRPHLSLEPRDRVGILHPVRHQHLDRDDAIEMRVQRLINRPHPAAPNLPQQDVLAESHSGRRL